MASFTPVADSVSRHLHAITTARPPVLSRVKVACQSPSRRGELGGEGQARSRCNATTKGLARMRLRESDWLDVSTCLSCVAFTRVGTKEFDRLQARITANSSVSERPAFCRFEWLSN